MSLRYLAGFITASYNPLKVPNAPTIGTATAGSTQATITFTAPSNVGGGAITGYIAVATKTSDGTAVSATGSASPITITGLTDGSAYTIQVAAVNTYGPGPYSAPSGSVTPVSPKLYSWGANSNGELGQNNRINASSPVQVGSDTNWSVAKLGRNCSVVIKTNGTLWSWGANDEGQLGQNDRVNRSSPVQVGALTTWSKISCGLGQTLAIKTDGTLWAWGNNGNGKLGDNSTTYRSSPVQIGAGTTWNSVSTSWVSSYAIKTDGTLWAWGQNNYGQLGQNNRIALSSPVQVGALTTWLNIAGGYAHVIATKTDGTLWAWGQNANGGALGLGDQVNRSSPVQIGALTNWSLTAAVPYTSAAVKTNGTMWSWGSNDYGRLGLNTSGSYTNISSPAQIGALTTWSLVVGGNGYKFSAIKTDGTLWSWGQNSSGELGLNDTAKRSSPTQVGALTTWLSVAGGFYSTLATSS